MAAEPGDWALLRQAKVSNSLPQLSQLHSFRTHRSLTKFDAVAAMTAAPQSVQVASGFPRCPLSSICCNPIMRSTAFV